MGSKMAETRRGTARWATAGGAPGMNGDLRIYLKSGYIVAVLANMDPPAAQRIAGWLDARLPMQG